MRCSQSRSLRTRSLGSSWITRDEDGAEAATVVIGTDAIIGIAATIVTAIVRVESGTGRRRERRLGAGSEYAPHPSGVSLAVGMVGIEGSRSIEP
jgi:hypothetical protein